MLFKKSISYPQVFDSISGRTLLDDEFTSINRCIALILTSAKGELLGSPDFGSRLYELLFDPLVEDTRTNIIDEIVKTLKKYEKRITIDKNDVDVVKDDKKQNSYKITISYKLANSDIENSTILKFEDGEVVNG